MKLPPHFRASLFEEARSPRAQAQWFARWLFLCLAVSALLCLSLFADSHWVTRWLPGMGGVQVAQAGVFIVTKTTDTNDGVCDADCSLREAIIAANAANGPDTIILPPGIYPLTQTGTLEDAAVTGDLDITDDLTILVLPAGTAVIDGGGIDRVFEIFNSTPTPIQVNIANVTIQNGNFGGTGGVYNHGQSTLTLSNSTISSNSGFGLYNSGADATVTLNNDTLSGNSNSGIQNDSGGTVNVNNSTLSGNSALNGGGIFAHSGTITLNNVTITANTATNGGGVRRTAGTVILKNTLIAGNSAPTGPDCLGTLFSGGDNLIGINHSDSCGLTNGSNDDQVGTSHDPINPLLGPLQNNGGPTFTHALLIGSPAINAGNLGGCTNDAGTPFTLDQRGTARPQGGRCDVGAYEIPWVKFKDSAYTVNEVGPTASITVTLEGPSAYTVTVGYTTTNGTAIAGSDYLTTTGTLTFTPFDQTEAFTVSITNDATFEGNETVNLTLGNPGGAMLSSPSTAILTIVDDDPPPAAQFSSNVYTVTEGTGAGTTASTITVTLTSAAGRPITVTYGTSNGTALAGSDYTAVTNTLVFNPGDTAKTFGVPITRDAIDESDETLSLALSNPVSATLDLTSTATLTILDDDPPPTVGFSSSTYSVSEGGGTATITVNLSPSSGQPVTVTYGTSNGTALAGSDYTAVTGTLTFNSGDTTKTFGVPITQDQTLEPNETLALTLSNAINATLGTNPATLTIIDDDHPPILFMYLPLVIRNFSKFFTSFEVEPNNRTADANGPLGSGLAINGYPQDLRDYFYFDSGAGTITLNLTNYAGSGQLQLYYQVVDVAHLVRYDPTPPFSIEVTDRPAGRYYIIIYTADPNPNTTSAYALVVTYP